MEALAGARPPAWRRASRRRCIDYRSIMRDAIARTRKTANVEFIWASTREVSNVIEVAEMDRHILTAPAAVLKKLPGLGTKPRGAVARCGQDVSR